MLFEKFTSKNEILPLRRLKLLYSPRKEREIRFELLIGA